MTAEAPCERSLRGVLRSPECSALDRLRKRELPILHLGRAAARPLYTERGSPKFEKAAMGWLERYSAESTPRMQHLAEITTGLASRER